MTTTQSADLPSLSQLQSLDGRVAVITGAGAGVGRATALRFAEAGALVTLADIDAEGVAETAAQLRERFGVECFEAQVDISSGPSVAALAESVAQRHGRLDIWVNTAAIFASHSVLDTTDDVWRSVLAVDLDGAFYCAREAARQMLAFGDGGVIVLCTSLAAHKGRMMRHHYGAAKHGVDALTKTLAIDLAGDGIRVLSVAPGITNSGGVDPTKQWGDTDVGAHEEIMDQARRQVPMNRIADPDELARAILFAASDMASFMTGSSLHVDGGAIAT